MPKPQACDAAYIKGSSQVDLRAGISNDRYTIEAFVKNVLDDRNNTGGSVAPDYGSLSYYAFFGAVAEPRQLRINRLAGCCHAHLAYPAARADNRIFTGML